MSSRAPEADVDLGSYAWNNDSILNVDRMLMVSLAEADPAMADLIKQEEARQRNGAEMIASENFASRAVRQATGSVLTNKYAEGLPGRRYYGGCEVVDLVENLARERAKQLFGVAHVNVQPHAGSQANMAAYRALIKPGDRVMAMRLDQGGHLTHGSPVNFSGTDYVVAGYGVHPETEQIDFDALAAQAREFKPALIVAGATSYPRQIDFAKFAEIAQACGAKLMVDMAHIAGLVAANLHPDPMQVADIVTTTTHKTLRGPRGGMILTRDLEIIKAVNKMVFPHLQGGPLEHVIGAKAVALEEAMRPEFATYQQRVLDNAKHLADALLQLGYRLVSGGTDNHLLLVDMRSVGMTGKDAEELLVTAGITANKNTIPFDPESPFVTSGLRLGTAAMTTRGWGEREFRRLAFLADKVLRHSDDVDVASRVEDAVREMCVPFPLP